VQGVGYATIEDVLRWDLGNNDHANSISNPVFCLLRSLSVPHLALRGVTFSVLCSGLKILIP